MPIRKRIKQVMLLVKQKIFPSQFDREMQRWWRDGGDFRFRLSYPLNERSFVMDLGGYQGQWSSDIYARYRCHIAIFEPVPQFCDVIRERFRHNGDIEVFQCGLGATTRREMISLSADGSSVFRKSSSRVEIEIRSICDWLVQNWPKDVDLIKINIEGGEYELMRALITSGMIQRFKAVQVQFHRLHKGSEREMIAIKEALAKTHMPQYEYLFMWESWQRKQ